MLGMSQITECSESSRSNVVGMFLAGEGLTGRLGWISAASHAPVPFSGPCALTERCLWPSVWQKSDQKAGGHGGHSHGGGHANKPSDMKVFRNPRATGELVAVCSGEKLEGVVSHPGERFHVHYIDNAKTVSGHEDQYNAQKGAALWMPVR